MAGLKRSSDGVKSECRTILVRMRDGKIEPAIPSSAELVVRHADAGCGLRARGQGAMAGFADTLGWIVEQRPVSRYTGIYRGSVNRSNS